MRRVALLVSIMALLSLGLALPVLAAAPSGDTYAGRASVGALPFSDTVDTTDATTDADDAEANASCGAPATDASVWYEFIAPADAELIVDVSSSDYSAGVIVATGTPGGSLSIVTCGPSSAYFTATSGQTYLILAFDDQFDGIGNGGTLQISIDAAPPPPTLDVTIASSGSFNAKTGMATIRGTVTCTGGEEFGRNFIEIQVTQSVGRVKISGYGYALFSCDGTTQPWAAQVGSETGKFAGGKAHVSMGASACGLTGCTGVAAEATVTLRK